MSCGSIARAAPSDGDRRGSQRRSLTAPVLQGNDVVVADYEGIMHWLSMDDGSFAARSNGGTPHQRGARKSPATWCIVQTDKGAIEAWRAPVK